MSKQKTCYYVKYDTMHTYGYAWYLKKNEAPACKCIMAVAESKTLGYDDLGELQCKRIISGEEYNAIHAFDNKVGTEDDLTVIKKLGSRIKVKLVRK